VKLLWPSKKKPKWERAWEEREETCFPTLFGGEGEGIFPLSFELFTQAFGQEAVDPRWLHGGVFRFAPTPDRPTWLHVSSGLSTDWEQENRSGFGAELTLETPWKSDDAILALLHLTAYDILLAHGRYGEARLLEVGSRVHLTMTFEGHGKTSGFLIAEPSHFPGEFKLETGPVQLLACVGITSEEMAFAQANGSAALADHLARAGVGAVTDPSRSTTV